jgi:flagellar biosynthesis protein FlhG
MHEQKDHSGLHLTSVGEPWARTKTAKQIWAVGGGKGGVGKSLVAASLSISLSQSGQQVTAIDLDLGGSNLHTALGIETSPHTLSDFLSRRVATLEQCAAPTGISHLSLISGVHDSVGVTQIDPFDQRRLIESFHQINTDYLLLDLGAGTHFSTIDYFLQADVGIVVLLPEPTSIENAYRFIKTAYYRKLWHATSLRDIRHLVEAALDSKNQLGLRSPSDLFREVAAKHPEIAPKLKQEIEQFRPKLIVNQTRTQADVDIGHSIRAVCKRYFGIELEYLGHFDYDSSVWQAIRRKKPVVMEFPHCHLVSQVSRIVSHLLHDRTNQPPPSAPGQDPNGLK